MKYPVNFFWLCIGVFCACGITSHQLIHVYRPLTKSDLRGFLSRTYAENPTFVESLPLLKDEDLQRYAKQLAFMVDSFYQQKSASTSHHRPDYHRRMLLLLLKKDRDKAKQVWLEEPITIHPTTQWNEIPPPARSLDLLAAEAQQRRIDHHQKHEEWTKQISLLQEKNGAQKEYLQQIIAQGIQDHYDHRRYILEHYLGHWRQEEEALIRKKVDLISLNPTISLIQLQQLLGFFNQLSTYNHELAAHLTEAHKLDLGSFGDPVLWEDSLSIQEKDWISITDLLERIWQRGEALPPQSRSAYEALCTLTALAVFLDHPSPKRQVNIRLQVLKKIPRWSKEMIFFLLTPITHQGVMQWKRHISQLEDQIQKSIQDPKQCQDILQRFIVEYTNNLAILEEKLR